jgi:hypothetical protein
MPIIMKKFLIILFLVLPIIGKAQKEASSIEDLIQTTKDGLAQKKEVTFNNQANTLQIGEYIIPLSKNTVVKVEFESKTFKVEFSLQKGTVIRSSVDPTWKRASFALPFKSRQAAKKFTHLFDELTEYENIN